MNVTPLNVAGLCLINAVTGKVPVRLAASTVFVQVLISFVVFPSVCVRISFRKYAAEAQSSASGARLTRVDVRSA